MIFNKYNFGNTSPNRLIPFRKAGGVFSNTETPILVLIRAF